MPTRSSLKYTGLSITVSSIGSSHTKSVQKVKNSGNLANFAGLLEMFNEKKVTFGQNNGSEESLAWSDWGWGGNAGTEGGSRERLSSPRLVASGRHQSCFL